MKVGSKHPGSSRVARTPGRHVHSLVPRRSTRYSPSGAVGQSRSVASFVMKRGPALSASAIFSASVEGRSGALAASVAGSKNRANHMVDSQEHRSFFMPSHSSLTPVRPGSRQSEDSDGPSPMLGTGTPRDL